MSARYLDPQYRVGSQFVNYDLPYQNSLATGITDGSSATIFGTDPAGYVQDRLAAIPAIGGGTAPSWLSSLGKGIAGALVGIIILALGIWVLVKQ